MNARPTRTAVPVANAGVAVSERIGPFEAMRRGFWGRCPHCGNGRLFRAFLKVADNCPACDEEFHHHRADDFPAYIVIVIVGHITVPLVLAVETHIAPSYWVHIAVWPAVVATLSLALLQPVKGAIVALQWALGMHGFEQSRRDRGAVTCAVATGTSRD